MPKNALGIHCNSLICAGEQIMEKPKSVRKRMKLARVSLDIKTSEIAKEMGVKSSSITYLENKEEDTPFIKYLGVLKEHGVDINNIFNSSCPIGTAIKSIRVKLGLKLVYVAERLAVNTSSVRYLENRDDNSAFAKYLSILQRRGIDLNILFEKV